MIPGFGTQEFMVHRKKKKKNLCPDSFSSCLQSDNNTQRLQLCCHVSFILLSILQHWIISWEESVTIQIWLSFNCYCPNIKILICSPKLLSLSLFPLPHWPWAFCSSKNCESHTPFSSFIDSLFSRQLSQPPLFLPSGLKLTKNFLPFNWVFAAMIKPIIALIFLYSKIGMLGLMIFS